MTTVELSEPEDSSKKFLKIESTCIYTQGWLFLYLDLWIIKLCLVRLQQGNRPAALVLIVLRKIKRVREITAHGHHFHGLCHFRYPLCGYLFLILKLLEVNLFALSHANLTRLLSWSIFVWFSLTKPFYFLVLPFLLWFLTSLCIFGPGSDK